MWFHSVCPPYNVHAFLQMLHFQADQSVKCYREETNSRLNSCAIKTTRPTACIYNPSLAMTQSEKHLCVFTALDRNTAAVNRRHPRPADVARTHRSIGGTGGRLERTPGSVTATCSLSRSDKPGWKRDCSIFFLRSPNLPGGMEYTAAMATALPPVRSEACVKRHE